MEQKAGQTATLPRRRYITCMILAKPANLGIPLPLERIAEICRQRDVEELDIFGSALRSDFSSHSDVDFLAVFRHNDGPWAGKFGELEEDLSKLLGRRVDVVDKRAVEQDLNWVRRRHILDGAVTVYVA